MDFDPKKNYYEILWVAENATQEDIKKTFRKAAVKHHPDRGGSKEKFQEINEAYQILSDEQKRQQYDMFRKGWFGVGGSGFDFWGFGGFGGGAQVDFWGFWDIGDLLGGMFGGGGFGWWRQTPKKGNDLEKQISISFDEAFLGVKKKISYTRLKKIDGLIYETCKTCKGSGKITQQKQSIFGIIQTQTPCPDCYGTWKIAHKDGKVAPNGGLKEHKEILTVEVPAGIKDGSHLRYSERGNDGYGELTPGDLFVKINITASSKYERKGNDLWLTVDVSLFDLVLWAEIEVPHPEGKMKVKIPKGTQFGQKVRVAGKGFGEKGLFTRRGDMFLKLNVAIPKKLSKEQEVLRKKLQSAS